VYQKDKEIERWYVAPPGGLWADPGEWENGERTPVGPPGSDAAAMGKGARYGPPGVL